MKKFMFAALLLAGVVAFIAPPQAFAQEEKPFTIHGEVRSRAEFDNNVDDLHDGEDPATPGANGFDDGALFFPYRVRIAAEGHFTKNVAGWIEFQNTGSWGDSLDLGTPLPSGPRRGTTDFSPATKTMMYQGYITLNQLWSKNFSLKIGRQELVAGNEMLLGDEDFYAGISHDGAVGTWDLKSIDIMAWWTRAVQDQIQPIFGEGNFTPDAIDWSGAADLDNTDFWGGYATWTFKKAQMLDFYIMNVNNRGVGSRFSTLGARYAHDDRTKNSFFWNIEIAQQFGIAASEAVTTAPTDIDASGMAIEGWFGFNMKQAKNVHRFYGRYEFASGDDATSSDDNEGFMELYGDHHNRLGRGDWFQLNSNSSGLASDAIAVCTPGIVGCGSGISAFSVGYNGFYNDRHELGVAFWSYALDQASDVDPGLLATEVQEEDSLGTAWDLWYGFTFSKNVSFEASYSVLSPGDALGLSPTVATFPTAQDDSVQRLYGQIRLRF